MISSLEDASLLIKGVKQSKMKQKNKRVDLSAYYYLHEVLVY